MGWNRGKRSKSNVSCWRGESLSVFLHIDVLRLKAKGCVTKLYQGTVSILETKAVTATQWQYQLLHVQPNPICNYVEMDSFSHLLNRK